MRRVLLSSVVVLSVLASCANEPDSFDEATGTPEAPVQPLTEPSSLASANTALAPAQANFSWWCQPGNLRCYLDPSWSTGQPPLQFTWTFPPGAFSSGGDAPTVSFSRSGTYSVTLRVRDALGQESTITKPVIPAGQYRPLPGSWSNSSRPGASLDLFATPNGGYTASWYTFTPDGAPVWYTTGTSYWYNNSWSAPLYISTWNGSSNVLTLVGSLELRLMSRFSAAFTYTVNGVSGNEPYMQQGGGSDRTGAWYEPAHPGWGLNIQEQSGFYGATVAFYEGSQPRWAQGSTTAGPSVSMGLNWMSGPGLCPGCTYVGPPSAQYVGSVSIQIPSYSTSGWTTMNITTPSGARWALPWVNVVKLTQ
ncbi:MAG TPA: PKD domain-containing protein [Myxococcaceae bacterium]|nr:PKD domain-containing protein [Myxococcaceae bacterium]